MMSQVIEWDGEISRWPEIGEVPKMVEVTEFRLKSGAGKDFYNAIKKTRRLIGKKVLDESKPA